MCPLHPDNTAWKKLFCPIMDHIIITDQHNLSKSLKPNWNAHVYDVGFVNHHSFVMTATVERQETLCRRQNSFIGGHVTILLNMKIQSYHLIDRGCHNGSLFWWQSWKAVHRDTHLSTLDIYSEFNSAHLHTVRPLKSATRQHSCRSPVWHADTDLQTVDNMVNLTAVSPWTSYQWN